MKDDEDDSPNFKKVTRSLIDAISRIFEIATIRELPEERKDRERKI